MDFITSYVPNHHLSLEVDGLVSLSYTPAVMVCSFLFLMHSGFY